MGGTWHLHYDLSTDENDSTSDDSGSYEPESVAEDKTSKQTSK